MTTRTNVRLTCLALTTLINITTGPYMNYMYLLYVFVSYCRVTDVHIITVNVFDLNWALNMVYIIFHQLI